MWKQPGNKQDLGHNPDLYEINGENSRILCCQDTATGAQFTHSMTQGYFHLHQWSHWYSLEKELYWWKVGTIFDNICFPYSAVFWSSLCWMLNTWNKTSTREHLHFSISVLAMLQVNRSFTSEKNGCDYAVMSLPKLCKQQFATAHRQCSTHLSHAPTPLCLQVSSLKCLLWLLSTPCQFADQNLFVYLLVKCKLLKKYCIFNTAISCKTDTSY